MLTHLYLYLYFLWFILLASNKCAFLKEQGERLKDRMVYIAEQNKLLQKATKLISEIEKFIEKGNKILGDAQAAPNSYCREANESEQLFANAEELLSSNALGDKEILEKLMVLVDSGKGVRKELLDRYDLWNKFRTERDLATDKLEAIHEPIDEIMEKPLRLVPEVVNDLELLKVCLVDCFVILTWRFEKEDRLPD